MQRKLTARDEYLLQEQQRVNDSATLRDRFHQLKALSVEIAYKDSEDRSQHGQMKYTANLAHAKSVFRFSCPNRECVEGDFDLSTELATAIDRRERTVTGKVTCPGWQSRATVGRQSCNTVLCYTLNIEYEKVAAAPSDMKSAKR